MDAVVSSINVAHTAERHATTEAEVLKAQGDSEQVQAEPAAEDCDSEQCLGVSVVTGSLVCFAYTWTAGLGVVNVYQ